MLAKKDRAGAARRNVSSDQGRGKVRSVLERVAFQCVERLEARQLLSTVVPSADAAPQLASEGPVEVDLRASDLTSGQEVDTWNNTGVSAGTFFPWGVGGAPTAGPQTDANGVSYEAVDFNGASALSSSFLSPDDLNNNSARSIEVWALNPTIDSVEETMVSWARRGGPDGTNEGFSYGSNYTIGEWGAEYDMTWSGSALPGGPTTPPTANVWHDLTFTYDGNGTEEVYIDGQLRLKGASNGTQNVGQLATASGFTINLGAQNDGTNNPAIPGILDIASVRISGGALTAADVLQNFQAGVPGQAAPLPAAPVLAAPVAGDGKAVLSWNSVPTATTYSVFRSDPAHTTPTAVATAVTGTTFTDTNLTGGVAYTYYVTATNATGSGPNSNTQTITAITGPATPLSFVASRVGGTNQVSVTWTAAPTAGTDTTYDVKRGTALNGDGTLGGTITDITPGGTSATSAVDTAAATNSTYYYTVTATDSAGTSPATTAAKVNPITTSNTTLNSEGTVEVDVRAIDAAPGAATSIANEGAAGGSFKPWTANAPTVGPATDSNGVTYEAINFNGQTALTSTFTAPDDLTDANPRSIEVWVLNPTIVGAEETMVSWGRRGGPDGTNEGFSYGDTYGIGEWGGEYDMTWAGSAVAGGPTTAPAANLWHNLAFTYDGNGTEDVYVDGQLQLTGASDGTQSIAQLMTAAGFPVNLGAQNDGANNPAIFGNLDIASVRISGGALTADDVQHNFQAGVPGQSAPAAAPAAAPTLAPPVISTALVQLSWSYVGDAGTGFSYDVFRSDTAHPTAVAVASGLHSLTYTDTSVTNGVQYTYYVVAKNSAGSGPQSNPINATPVPTAPATPTNLSAIRIGISPIVGLTWSPVQFATSYDVKRGTALNGDGTLGGTITDITPGGTTATSAVDTNAPTGSDLYYTVTAINSGLSSPAATPVLVAQVPTTQGLNDNVYHLGGGNTNAFNAVFGGDNAALQRVSDWAASHTPTYSFLNTADQFVYAGGSGASTTTFLGNDANGPATADPLNQNDTIYDAQGYFTAPTAGTYTFQIGDGTNNQTDDIVGIYVNGNGTPGSGVLVAADGWQGATSPLGTDTTHPGLATFTLPAGNIPVEIIYGNGFGGAFVNGVAITDPNGAQVAYGVVPPATPDTVNNITDSTGGTTITLRRAGNQVEVLQGSTVSYVNAADTTGLTLHNTGPQDTVVLENGAGNPLPDKLSFDGSFAVNGFDGTVDVPTKIDILNSTVAINYTGTSPLSAIQAALTAGQITSSRLTTGQAIADVDTAPAGTTPGNVTLSVAHVGDTNLDAKVNFTDLLTLAQNYGKSGLDWARGDFNYDGSVNFSDLLALAQNYGFGAQAAASNPLAAATDSLLLSKKRRA